VFRCEKRPVAVHARRIQLMKDVEALRTRRFPLFTQIASTRFAVRMVLRQCPAARWALIVAPISFGAWPLRRFGEGGFLQATRGRSLLLSNGSLRLAAFGAEIHAAMKLLATRTEHRRSHSLPTCSSPKDLRDSHETEANSGKSI
jgi:hypothetical protein